MVKALPNGSLKRKMLRELSGMMGQLVAIASVVAIGTMVLIISLSTRLSIAQSQQYFYDQYQFADVFMHVTRAPNDMAMRLQELPGVNQVETRIIASARIQIDDFPEPIQGQFQSVPDFSEPMLNRLYYRYGGPPQAGQIPQVVVTEPFAEAHHLQVGDSIQAILNGRLQRLEISGIALSPEHIYQLEPNSILPDYQRFGVFFMQRSALATVFDLEGAFNQVSVSIQYGADPHDVVSQMNALLERFGSHGAYLREEQASHRFLSEELEQLRILSWVLPTIFLSVAAFLLHVLMGRMMLMQRQTIALLKAFGYSNRQILTHYLSFSLCIVGLGLIVGTLLGYWVAEPLARLYAMYFKFPEFMFGIQIQALGVAMAITALAALAGTFSSVRKALIMSPAEAMRPPAPPSFHHHQSILGPMYQKLTPGTRMIVRTLSRHWFRSVIAIFGIGMSGALLILGGHQFNAVDHMLDHQYRGVFRMDLDVQFTEARPHRVIHELTSIPGVFFAEGYRQVPVRLHNRHQYERVSLSGLPEQPHLRHVLNQQMKSETLPGDGILLTRYLAESLQLNAGDSVYVETLVGHQRRLELRVAALVDEPIGIGAYMERVALNRTLFEDDVVDGAWLLIDATDPTVYQTLQRLPYIASIGSLLDAESDIRDYIQDTVLSVMMIMFFLAGTMTFAVVYNNARIMFSERERELASMRVLGFTRWEVLWVLVGELAVLIVIAIPLGWLFGAGFSYAMVSALSMDMFRIPWVLDMRLFAMATFGVLFAALLSIALISRRVLNLDMIQALKTE